MAISFPSIMILKLSPLDYAASDNSIRMVFVTEPSSEAWPCKVRGGGQHAFRARRGGFIKIGILQWAHVVNFYLVQKWQLQ